MLWYRKKTIVPTAKSRVVNFHCLFNHSTDKNGYFFILVGLSLVGDINGPDNDCNGFIGLKYMDSYITQPRQ